MPEQILIEFNADTSSLTPAIDLLKKMGNISEEDVAKFKKMQDESQKAFKHIQDNSGKTIKGLSDLNKSVEGVVNSLIEGMGEGVADALAEAGVNVEDFKKAIDDSKKSADNLTNSEQKLNQILRAQKAEAALTRKAMDDLAESGKKNTKEYTELEKKYQSLIKSAGNLKDTIGDVSDEISTAGSDTSGLDKTLRLANLGVGAFTAYQGTLEMFGTNSEDAQRALVKLNAAMAILNGLQAIQEELSKKDSLATKGLTFVKAGYNLVVGQSTGALKLFRIALASTGIGLIVIALAALIMNFDKIKNAVLNSFPALKGFGETWDKVKAITSGFFNSLFSSLNLYATIMYDIFTLKWGDIGDDFKKGGQDIALAFKNGYESKMTELRLEKIKKDLTKNIGEIEINIKINERQTGKTDFEGRIKKAQDESQKAAIELSKFLREAGDDISNFTEEQITKVNEYKNAVVIAESEITNQKRAQFKQSLEDSVNLANARVLNAVNGSKAELNARYSLAKSEYNLAINEVGITEAKKAEIIAQYNDKIEQLNKEANERRQKNTLASYEAQIIEMERMGLDGDVRYFNKKKQLIYTDYSFQIKEAIKQYGAQSGIVLKLEQDKLKELEKVKDEQKLKDLSASKSLIQARLNIVEEGSADELKAKLDMLDNEKEAEIIAAGKNKAKIWEIETKFIKAKEDLYKASDRKILEDAIGTKIEENNTKLATLQRSSINQNNAEIIELKKANIDYQLQLDKDAVNNSVASAEYKAAKIKSIEQKAIADKQALMDEALKAEMEYDAEITNIALANEKKRLEISLSSNNMRLKDRIAARKRMKEIDKEVIDEEATMNDEKYLLGLITEEEYQKNLLAIKGKYLDLELEQEKKKEENKKALINAGFDFLKQVSDAYFESDAQNRQATVDAEISALEDRKSKELDNKNLTEQQKANIEEKYKQREMQIKKRAWEAEQKAKEQQAIINGALAVTNILATMPKFDFGVASALAIGAAIASTTMQVIKIRQAKFPGFKTGTRNAPKGYAWVGEEGPELVELSGGEKIYKYRHSMKIEEAWRGGSMATPDEILTLQTQLPNVNNELISNYNVNNHGRIEIDYERLGRSVAKYMPEPVSNNINMDEDGFTKHIERKLSKQTIRNKRYKFT